MRRNFGTSRALASGKPPLSLDVFGTQDVFERVQRRKVCTSRRVRGVLEAKARVKKNI